MLIFYFKFINKCHFYFQIVVIISLYLTHSHSIVVKKIIFSEIKKKNFFKDVLFQTRDVANFLFHNLTLKKMKLSLIFKIVINFLKKEKKK